MRISLLAAAALAAVAPAAAQETPAEDHADIMVLGENPEKQISDFVSALTVAPGPDPIGRFDREALCPEAVGLNAAHNAAITTRMRRVADAARIRLADPGCRPNALVIITRDKEEMIAALRRKYPVLFLDAANESIRIPRQRGPVTAWHLEGRVDRMGSPVPFNEDEGYYVLNTPVTPSRISATMRPIFLGAVVVIEVDALIGLTTTQIADYAAMRAFAKTDPARVRKSKVPTILTVLDAPMDSEVPLTLTQWDMGYLKGLYAAPENHNAYTQLGEIRRGLTRELKEGEPGEP